MRRRIHPVQLAVALIVGSTLASLGVFQYEARHPRDASSEAAYAEFIAKCEPLAEWLPPGVTVGYFLDVLRPESKEPDFEARLYLAQYVLTPRRLKAGLDSAWVVVDCDDAAAASETAEKSGWSLVADLHNGLRLYRTGVEE